MTNILFKEECQLLRKQGLTLNEIVSATQRPKTSVYFHIRNIPLSTQKKREICQASTQRIVEFNYSRKGKSLRKFKEFDGWNRQTVLLVSHLLFDGEMRYSGCIYNNRSKTLIERVENLFKYIYKYKPHKYFKKGAVISISYFNVALARYIKGQSETLIHQIGVLPLDLKKAFLQAFYDDEGCIDFNDGTRRVRGYQHNQQILKLVQHLLLEFGIESKIQGSVEIVISRKHNLERFAKEINFSRGVRVNGNRSNSIWKKSLEKREILKMALDSYQN